MGKEKALAVMAAGMGSRFGGLKQITPLNEQGEVLLDFSVYDAIRAGFGKIIFIIKREMEKDFRENIGQRIEKHVDVAYCFQELSDVPAGFAVPEGRERPWGTGHAIYSAREELCGDFAIVNADDFYGAEALKLVYDYLSTGDTYVMAGYRLGNTLTENGFVTRGCCEADGEGWLTGVVERTHIESRGGYAEHILDSGEKLRLELDQLVSMNLWGFKQSFAGELAEDFAEAFPEIVRLNPLRGEYYYYKAVERAMRAGRARVKVLPTNERWHGITYMEDMPHVIRSLEEMKTRGLYPKSLW